MCPHAPCLNAAFPPLNSTGHFHLYLNARISPEVPCTCPEFGCVLLRCPVRSPLADPAVHRQILCRHRNEYEAKKNNKKPIIPGNLDKRTCFHWFQSLITCIDYYTLPPPPSGFCQSRNPLLPSKTLLYAYFVLLHPAPLWHPSGMPRALSSVVPVVMVHLPSGARVVLVSLLTGTRRPFSILPRRMEPRCEQLSGLLEWMCRLPFVHVRPCVIAQRGRILRWRSMALNGCLPRLPCFAQFQFSGAGWHSVFHVPCLPHMYLFLTRKRIRSKTQNHFPTLSPFFTPMSQPKRRYHRISLQGHSQRSRSYGAAACASRNRLARHRWGNKMNTTRATSPSAQPCTSPPSDPHPLKQARGTQGPTRDESRQHGLPSVLGDRPWHR